MVKRRGRKLTRTMMRTMTMIRTKRDGEDKYEEVEVREEEAGVCLYNPQLAHTPNSGHASVPLRASLAAPYT